MKLFALAAVVVTAALALLVSPFASSEPDGLERVARDKGFEEERTRHRLEDSPVADYSLDAVTDESWSRRASGVAGAVAAGALGAGLFALLRRGRRRSGPDGGRVP
jgi:hypothetical protein